jgi:hypothetical protein
MICNHVFDGPTCVNCGYTSGGIDNPICVIYDGLEYVVPFSSSFSDFLSMCLGINYTDTVLGGYWVALTEYGEIEITEYTFLGEFGHSVTVAYREYEIGGGDVINPADCMHCFDSYGVCEYCGMPCTHNEWKEGYCAYCGYECNHAGWYGGVCGFCGYTCMHDFDNGFCMRCNSYAYEVSRTLTVFYNGEAYEVEMGTTVSQFVNGYLGLDFDMTSSMGFWTLRIDADAIYVGSETYFCDYEGTLFLEYTEYAMGPFM